MIEADFAIMHKTRPAHDVVAVTEVTGRVRGKIAIIGDDITTTGGTLIAGAQALKEHGATDVWVFVTHALISKEYPRHESGQVHRINLCLVDRGYKPDVVHKLCRESAHAAVLRPSLVHSVCITGRSIQPLGKSHGETPSSPGSQDLRHRSA